MKVTIKNSLRKIVIGGITLLFSQNLLAQFDEKVSYIPPSPTCGTIIKYGNTPVNLYTGVPEIKADLYALEAKNYSLPIYLSYHAGGNKVQDVASNIGLGWNISTNCLITRIVRGRPDEQENGYFSGMGSKIYGVLDTATMNKIMDNKLDAEPDIFYYSIPGYFGRFVFDKDKKPILLPDNGVRILNSPFKKELSVDGWILADLDGNTYYFGTSASSIETTVSTTLNEKESIVQNFNSGWYLNKILTANNIETINFNYIEGSPIKTTYYRKRKKYRYKTTITHSRSWLEELPLISFLVDDKHESTIEKIDYAVWSNNIEVKIEKPKYLGSIVSSNQCASFKYDLVNKRKDVLNGLQLVSIDINSYDNKLIRKFEFKQSYILSKDIDKLEDFSEGIIQALNSKKNALILQGAQPGTGLLESYYKAMTDIHNLRIAGIEKNENFESQVIAIAKPLLGGTFSAPSAGPSEELYRLKLDGVFQVSSLSYKIPLFQFEYNTTENLAPRFSKKMDHWGYNNNNQFSAFPNTDYQIGDKIYEANAKETDVNKVKSYVLTKIVFPTGGFKQFEYEPNAYYNTEKQANLIVGGLRIKQIVDNPGENKKSIITSYSYLKSGKTESSGNLYTFKPCYISNITDSYVNNSLHYITPPDPTGSFAIPPTLRGQIKADRIDPTPFSQNLINTGITAFAPIINSYFSGSKPTEWSQTWFGPFFIISSTPLNNLFDINGINVGYSEVSVSNGEGKTISKFTDITDYPDLFSQNLVDYNFNVYDKSIPVNDPYTPNTSYSFARGYLKEQLSYDSKGTLLKKITNQYEFNTQESSARGFKCAVGHMEYKDKKTFNIYYVVGKYDEIGKNLLLKESTEEEYSYANGQQSVLKKINYSYDVNYPNLVKSINTINSEGSSSSIVYKRVVDKNLLTYSKQSETDALNKLYQNGQFSIILEEINSRNSVVVEQSKTGYKNWLINGKTLTLPETKYDVINNTVDARFQVINYDEKSNALQYANIPGANASLQWGYNNNYPIAECKNATTGEFYYEGFENDSSAQISKAHTGLKSNYGRSFTVPFTKPNTRTYIISWFEFDGSKWIQKKENYTGSKIFGATLFIDDIRITPADAQLTTYTYDTALGMTSAVDAKGQTDYYLYDDFGRLQFIKDADGNILKEYSYNYSIKATYYNTVKSQDFTRNNCSNAVGSTVTYTVPVEKYSSTISQADADNKAQNDITANGQAYANTTGTCTPLNTTFYLYSSTTFACQIIFDDVTNGKSYPFTIPASSGSMSRTELSFPATRCNITVKSIDPYAPVSGYKIALGSFTERVFPANYSSVDLTNYSNLTMTIYK